MPVSSPSLFTSEELAISAASAARQISSSSGEVSDTKALLATTSSTSFLVTFSSGDRAFVQFRRSEISLDENAFANSVLGEEIVPKVSRVHLDGAPVAFVSRFVDGRSWEDCEKEMNDEQHLAVAFELGKLIAKCRRTESSEKVLDDVVAPKLDRILKTVMEPKAKAAIQHVRNNLYSLKEFPLASCHMDLRASNIFLDSKYKLVSVVSWHHAVSLPIASNLGVIRSLATMNDEILNRTFEQTVRFVDGFMDGLGDLFSKVFTNGNNERVVVAAKAGKILWLWKDENAEPPEDAVSRLPRLFGWYLRMLR
ncbi:hypothetical protein BT69DRAFT_1350343 [Atractiella rhizophila]|nr:hypothetical protein BT69DRAFT_1350343 [Atractiella rhizophila]